MALIRAAKRERRFACLVADDRTRIQTVSGRAIASAPETLAGLLEVRGVGPVKTGWAPSTVVRLVVDLVETVERLPMDEDATTVLNDVRLPRLAVARHAGDEWSVVSQALTTHFCEGRCGCYALAFAPQHEKLSPSARIALF